MRNIFKYIFLFSFLSGFLFLSFESKSQVTIFGIVEDINTGQGIPNHQVNIVSHYDSVNQTGMSYYKNLQTNSLGFFIDTVSVPSQNIDFIISTLDCNQIVQTDTFNPSNAGIITFSICSNLPNCFSNFYTYEDTSNYKRIHFVNNSSGLGSLNYLWTFGDGGTSVAASPIHYYMNDGVYNVCLSVSIGNCSNTSCNTLTISSTAVCNASFTKTTYGLDVSFKGNSGSSRLSHYLWDFGDGTSTNGQKVQHKYSSPGSYIVKLNTLSIHPQTLDTCQSLYIDTIQVKKLKYGSVYGQVFADTSTIDDGSAYIYRYDVFDSVFYLIDTSDIYLIDTLNLSYYRFENLVYGNYIIKVFLDSASVMYNNFAPSYSGNTFLWNLANVIEVDTVTQNVPINLMKMNNDIGIGNISGYVLEGISKAPGDPVGGVLVYLVGPNGEIHDYQYSNELTGYYEFNNLAFNKYTIYADIINKVVIAPSASISASNPNVNNLNLYLGTDSVTSIEDITENYIVKIFPNPAEDILTISLKSSHNNENLKVEVFNVLGQKVLTTNFSINNGNNKLQLDLSSLKSDIYIIEITSAKGFSQQYKFIKL